MDILYLLIGMLAVGILMGWIAGLVWKDNLIEIRMVYIICVVTAIVVGLIDWFVIPAMGFSDSIKWVGVVLEPALGALAVIWLLRRSRQ